MNLETTLDHQNCFLAPLHYLCIFKAIETDCLSSILIPLTCHFLTITKPTCILADAYAATGLYHKYVTGFEGKQGKYGN